MTVHIFILKEAYIFLSGKSKKHNLDVVDTETAFLFCSNDSRTISRQRTISRHIISRQKVILMA